MPSSQRVSELWGERHEGGGGDGEGGLGEVGGGDQGMDASSNNVEGESSRGIKHTDGLANTRQCTDKG